jgi:hypothetical protein
MSRQTLVNDGFFSEVINNLQPEQTIDNRIDTGVNCPIVPSKTYWKFLQPSTVSGFTGGKENT